MKFQDLEDWTIHSDGVSIRVIKGGDINNVNDIIAFVSETPNVRISNRLCRVQIDHTPELGMLNIKDVNGENISPDVFIKGPYKTTYYRINQKARDWCDQILSSIGFI